MSDRTQLFFADSQITNVTEIYDDPRETILSDRTELALLWILLEKKSPNREIEVNMR
jgi:hypothetical protein